MLNKKQKEIYDYITKNKWKNDGVKSILIKGSAGVGKSYLTTLIAETLSSRCLVTATTNKAKELLKEKLDCEVLTIHSALGMVLEYSGLTPILRNIKAPRRTEILIIDEVSMLERDLYLQICQNNYPLVIYIGDEVQLPAVGNRADLKVDKEFVLTEQMRQDINDLNLQEVLNGLRTAIKKGERLTLKKEKINFYTKHNEFCKAYLNCNTSKRILAYYNKTVDAYNKNINGGDPYQIGDIVILDKPCGHLKNGSEAKITGIKHDGTKTLLKIRADGKTYLIIVFLKKGDENNYTQLKLSQNDYEAIHNIYHPKLLYASTIHKAQGDTLESVFIDFADIQAAYKKKPTQYNNFTEGISYDEMLRLLYVAISRAKKNVHIFAGDTRNYKTLHKALKN